MNFLKRLKERRRASDPKFDYSALGLDERLMIVASFVGDERVLRRFTFDESDTVRALLANCCQGCQDIYRRLAKDDYYVVRFNTAMNMEYDEEVVRTLMESTEPLILIALAERFINDDDELKSFCLEHESPLVRIAAIESLSSMSFLSNENNIRHYMVNDSDWRVVFAVLQKMEDIGDEEGIFDLIKHDNAMIKSHLLQSDLVTFDESETEELHMIAMKDKDWTIRALVAYLSESEDVLIHLAKDECRDVRLVVGSRLGFLDLEDYAELHSVMRSEEDVEVATIMAKSYLEGKFYSSHDYILPTAYLRMLSVEEDW